MKRAGMVVMALAFGVVSGVAAQQPQPPMRDSMRPMMRDRVPLMQGQMGPGPQELRAQVEARWSTMVQTQLGLTDQQMERLRGAERANQDRHRDLGRREEDLHRALQQQLQPGVAANGDSVSRTLDALAGLRVQHAQSDQQLLRDLAFLAPVQRARYVIMARRFRDRVEDVMRERREDVMERRPMMRPGGGPDAMQRRPRPVEEF